MQPGEIQVALEALGIRRAPDTRKLKKWIKTRCEGLTKTGGYELVYSERSSLLGDSTPTVKLTRVSWHTEWAKLITVSRSWPYLSLSDTVLRKKRSEVLLTIVLGQPGGPRVTGEIPSN